MPWTPYFEINAKQGTIGVRLQGHTDKNNIIVLAKMQWGT